MLEEILALLDPERKNKKAFEEGVWLEPSGIDPRGPNVYTDTPPRPQDPMYRQFGRRRGIKERVLDLQNKAEALRPNVGDWPDIERGGYNRRPAPAVNVAAPMNRPMAPGNDPYAAYKGTFPIDQATQNRYAEDESRMRMRSAQSDMMRQRRAQRARMAQRDPVELLIDEYLGR